MNKTLALLASIAVSVSMFSASAQFGPPGALAGPKLGGATAKLFGDNQTFSATMVMQTSNEGKPIAMTGKLSYDTGKSRFEMNFADTPGMTTQNAAQMKTMGMDRIVAINRPDKKVTYSVFPGLQSYVEKDLSDAMPATTAASDYKVETAEIGKDTVDGHPCVKNKVTVTDKDGKPHVSTVWNATDLKNFPLKIQSTEDGGDVTMSFKNISLTKPDAGLFEAPSEYTKYSNPQVMFQQQLMKRMGGMGMPQPGMPQQ